MLFIAPIAAEKNERFQTKSPNLFDHMQKINFDFVVSNQVEPARGDVEWKHLLKCAGNPNGLSYNFEGIQSGLTDNQKNCDENLRIKTRILEM